MSHDPRMSEIDAIARVKLVDGPTLPRTSEDRYLVVSCLTGYRESQFYLSSLVMDLPRGSSAHDVRALARLEVAEALECDSTRVFVILLPEDAYQGLPEQEVRHES